MAERGPEHQVDILQDPELVATRREISRSLPLRTQRERVLPLVDRIIEITTEIRDQATNEDLYRAFSKWYETTLREIDLDPRSFLESLKEVLQDSIQDTVADGIREYLGRALGVNPQSLTGIEEMELTDIAREVAKFSEAREKLRATIEEYSSPSFLEAHVVPTLEELVKEYYPPQRDPDV